MSARAERRTTTLSFERPPAALVYMLSALGPRRRSEELPPALQGVWRGCRISPETHAAFCAATGLARGPELPIVLPAAVAFRLIMAVLTYRSFPVGIWRILQIRNHLLQHRPLAADATFDLEARFTAARRLEKGAELDLHTTLHERGELAWESLVTLFARGQLRGDEPPSPLASPPRANLEQQPSASWRMRDAAHLAMSRLTGDYNGIHLWSGYARRFGFARALYHPARVLGECLARLPSLPSGPTRLDVWLRGPVPHGAEVQLHLEPDSTSTVFALRAGDPRPSVLGRLSPAPSSSRLVDETGAPLCAT